MRFPNVSIAAILAASLLSAGASFAQAPGAYPTRPVRLIVSFAPGGPTDVVARIIANRFQEMLGQPAVVENRPGAGGNIAITAVAKAPADGYTLLVVSSALMVNPALYEKPPYDTLRDFEPITLAGYSPNIFTANPGAGAKTVQEVVALAKANPGKYSFASPGTGTTPSLAAEMFKMAAGVAITNVPYNGAAPAVQAVLANQTPFGFTAITPAVPLVKAGRLRALAVTTAKRAAALPDVPTLAEAGFPNQETDTNQGVLAPAGTPKPIITRLHAEIVKILQSPDTRAKMDEIAFEVVASTPDEYAALIRAQTERYGKAARAAGMKAE